MIQIKNVKKTFNKTEVLKGVNIDIEKGEIFGIIGQSGAGKSTLLRCINGLESYDEGAIVVDDVTVDIKNKKVLRNLQKRMGMIFQGFNLLERLDVYHNVALPMKFWGIPTNTPEAKEKILNLIKLVGLEEKVHSKPKELSGGQKQRVAIARALALDPDFLLCDEATSALDPEITKGILALLQKINKEMGITIIIVTHQMEVVKQICQKVAFLSGGKVLAIGKPEQLFVWPKEQEMREFLREESDKLPSTGVNLKLFFFGEGNQRPIVTEMARELQTNFNICWAKLEDFREDVYGSLVLNMDEKDLEKACAFLDSKNVTWEVIK
ncbi:MULTISPECIES: methionine ABC transporter ATP-binding protein [Butyrivibrio]|jgi:D-methionine transport system ATP-binding protein|uniref:D-methionine transport system ATP-binding protein n=1 Tax=Butyrivibrio hungatei TaxID=185008 RepID=A0A1G5D1B9_9FIRM|nr:MULTISPECIES: methionine ABC transporter ATP-binding protein [Butyrivibrio]MBQ2610582.1 methionine ABC transporter ATP-binding protein [Butyrivibrio sp.]MBQ4220393.1 methionine ABC transporter ATP-binding protein [Butyrivibrio sp.]MBR4357303.1 methionine ABC transporter ATP-binding protein [Butyrivibrio sp.]MCR4996586.1 methionine ABC transporter ATP-binding protein [Butyrivibrio sp.]MEE3469720.1 methionine ABC transporter ATP-binding protein [Butyrivibrio hungatei]